MRLRVRLRVWTSSGLTPSAARDAVTFSIFSRFTRLASLALAAIDWTHKIPERFANVWAYRARLLARPSYAKALDEARPYRHYFPLGAPVGRD